MPLSDAEKKRRSRASKPRAYHDREREMSRKRMAIGRARNRAQKRVSQLRSLLNDKDKKVFQERADKEKQRLVCHWFSDRNLRFDPKVINDKRILNVFMTKLDLYKIEIQVAEFEISLMGIEKVEDDAAKEVNAASWSDKGTSWLDKGKEETAAKGREIIPSRNSSEQNFSAQIDRFLEKETPGSNICGREFQGVLDAKQEEVAKPGHPGTDDTAGPGSDIDRLLEKETEEVREILGVKQEEVEISGAKREEVARQESQRWDDEVLAAEAMAILQTSRGGTTNSL